MFVYLCICIYIYIYRERERDTCISLSLYIYIYIHDFRPLGNVGGSGRKGTFYYLVNVICLFCRSFTKSLLVMGWFVSFAPYSYILCTSLSRVMALARLPAGGGRHAQIFFGLNITTRRNNTHKHNTCLNRCLCFMCIFVL